MSRLNERVELLVRDRAFKKRLRTFAIINKTYTNQLSLFLSDAFHIYENQITPILNEYQMIKVSSKIVAEFEKKSLHHATTTTTTTE